MGRKVTPDWQEVLDVLSQYGEDGISENDFLSSKDYQVYRDRKRVLSQMFFTQDPKLYEYHPDKQGQGIIRITERGEEVRKNGI